MSGEGWRTVDDWLRPGKDADGRPSAVVGYGGDNAYFFTDAWPTSVPGRFFEPGKSYTKFGLYAMWRFGDTSSDSLSRARQELIAMGYADELADRPRHEPPDSAGNAVQDAPPPPVGLRSMLLRGAEIEQQEPLTPLVQGLIDLNTLCVLYGAYGSGKSFVALDLAAHIATGRKWHGREVHQGPVLYIVGEGAHGMRGRWRAWADRYGQDDTPDLVWLPFPAQLSPKLNHHAELMEIVRELRPVAVFIDTFARSTGGLDENDTGAMSAIITALDEIRIAAGQGPAIIPVHHTGWNTTRLRGSVALPAAADAVIKVEKEADWVTVTHEKAKETEPLPPIHFKLTAAEPSATLTKVDGRERSALLDEVKQLNALKQLEIVDLGGGATAAEWRQMLGLEVRDFYPLVKQLLAAQLIDKRDAKMSLSPRGVEAVQLGKLPGIRLQP